MTSAGLDGFWALTDGTPVHAPGATSVDWQRIEVQAGDHDLDEICGGTPALLPLARRPSGQPLIVGRDRRGQEVVLAATGTEGVQLAFDPELAVTDLIERAALTPRPPASARLPVSYRIAPAGLRRRVRDALVRRRRRSLASGFPAWPVEPSVELVRHAWRFLRADGAEEAGRWPGGKRFALVLTHDVDSAEGLAAAAAIAAEEEAHGLRSCWYVVGRDYSIDDEALSRLRHAGHEIGLHGAHHDNREAFLSPTALGDRLEACRELCERHDIAGFRSPSLLRTTTLYEALAGRLAYDSSMPDSGLLPGRNGCATAFPLRWAGVPVVPLTLPTDGQLLSLGLGAQEILAAWVHKAEWVARVGGVATLLTHPERGFLAEPAAREAYRRFLDWAAARADAWHALPREVASAAPTAPAFSEQRAA